MGRLTEAYGFLRAKVGDMNPMWVKHNITSLELSKALYSLRKSRLLTEKKDKKNGKHEDGTLGI